MEKSIIFLGDIHGNFKVIKDYILKKQIENSHIIQVGDFGIGFYTDEIEEVKLNDLDQFLFSTNNMLYVIRGNHDNPSYFEGNYMFDNLKLLPDYTVLQIESFKILFVGGAISIDRIPRKIKQVQLKDIQLHFNDEEFNLDLDRINCLSDIDIVVTHTSPDFCHPNNSNGFSRIVYEFAHNDYSLLVDLVHERKNITKLWNEVKIKNNPKYWFYGHFHTSHTEIYDSTIFKLLDVYEFYTIN